MASKVLRWNLSRKQLLKKKKDELRRFWILGGTEERCSEGMMKSSVILNFCLGQHRRRENILHIKKKILRYRNLEACGVIRPNGSGSLRNLVCCLNYSSVLFKISLTCWHAAFRTFLCFARASISVQNPGITLQISFQPCSSRSSLWLTS